MSNAHYHPEDRLDPYGNPYQPPRKTNFLLIGVIVGVVLAGLCCVGSCVGLGGLGLSVMTEEVRQEIRDVPEFKAEIGEIQKMSLNLTKSSADSQDDTWYFDVEGDSGSGELFVRTRSVPGGGEEILEASLRMRDGTKVEIPIR